MTKDEYKAEFRAILEPPLKTKRPGINYLAARDGEDGLIVQTVARLEALMKEAENILDAFVDTEHELLEEYHADTRRRQPDGTRVYSNVTPFLGALHFRCGPRVKHGIVYP